MKGLRFPQAVFTVVHESEPCWGFAGSQHELDNRTAAHGDRVQQRPEPLLLRSPEWCQ